MTRAVILDFDFTLADSSKGFLECHAAAARALGLALPRPDDALRTVGMSLAAAFDRLYGRANARVRDDYIAHWQRRADEVMTDLTLMLDGAIEAVRTLRGGGFELAIVSQKLGHRIEAVLRREGLDDAFAAVVGGGDMPRFKPEPDGLLIACGRLGCRPERAVYVGDTAIDAEAAARAAMPFVAVLSGVTPADAFAAHAPVAVLDSVALLPRLLNGNRGAH